MQSYEEQYMKNLSTIFMTGTEERNKRTRIITSRIPATQIVVDLEREFPILLSKKVNWKTAVDEILWIMQRQSNNTNDLNSKIWDSWADEDGSIGKAYGYQVNQKVCVKQEGCKQHYQSQVHYVLETLKKDPSNRQCVIDMWNVKDLGEMNLVPCCYSSVWNIIDGRLNCMLVQRSADYPVGVPFDTTQYAVLTHLFARHIGVRPGILTHVMADSHIYENQMEGVKKQIYNWSHCVYGKKQPKAKLIFKEDAPTDFWKISLSDMDVIDYDPCQPIKYEVAV